MHEVSSLGSSKRLNEEAEDREEEVPTVDPVVEQEEQEEASVWEVDDSSSGSPGGQHVSEEETCSQPTESPRSTTTCRDQANEQPASPTGEASGRNGPAITPASQSGLPLHCENPADRPNLAEDDCPSSCPPAEPEGAGVAGEQTLRGLRLRWQQASLA